jgi:hypothetical protein
VEAVVRNDAAGEGQVSVNVRLHDAAGRTFQKEQSLNLRRREQVMLVVDIEAPAGTYRADVDVRYPPE